MRNIHRIFISFMFSALIALIFFDSANASSSGTYGANITWTLSDSGVLTISGSGAMYEPTDEEVSPWRNDQTIKKVVITSGVTTLSNSAFVNCLNLTSISFPSSLISIGDNAFYSCKNLPSISFPSGLISIGKWAFAYCETLPSVTLPDTVNSIDRYAFYNCTGLETVLFNSDASFGSSVYFYSQFDKCTKLKSLVYENGCTVINGNGFRGCSSLSNITIPATATTIFGFPQCNSLSIHYAGTKNAAKQILPNGTNTTIHCATWYCSDGTTNFCTDTEGSCGSNVYYSYHEKVLRIYGSGEMNDFWNRKQEESSAPWSGMIIEKAIIEDGVTYLGSGILSYCSSLNELTISDTVTQINSTANFDSYGISSSYRIKCFADSTAQTFAISNNIPYVLLIKINFDANSGSVNTNSTIVTHGSTYGTLPTPTRTGYTFVGWFTSANDGTLITSSSTVSITANQTLYAHWNANTYTVSFNANGGSTSTTSKAVTYGSTYGTLPTPTRTGYEFDGWYTAASGGSQITSSSSVSITANQTLYAHWIKTYTVSYNVNGGTGTPSSQTKKENVPLILSSIKPTKTYVIQYNSNGGSVSPASKNVSCTFNNWNTSINGSGTSYAPGSTYSTNADVSLYAQWTNPTAGSLTTPTRSGYTFAGWYTSATGGTRINETTTIAENLTVYAHWTGKGYQMGINTYSFSNYGDSDSPGGHCFGMSITSSGYYTGALNIGIIGGNSTLYSYSKTATVKRPICYYQGIQGSYSSRATVAGGSWYLYDVYNISLDWQEVVNYVKNHTYDGTGSLQIGFRKRNEGGHAINFLRYENVDGQDRIYAYDNNFPNQETYFYMDSSGNVKQSPVGTFSGTIDCIALRNVRTYFNIAGSFDSSHVIYMPKDSATVQGFTCSYMDGVFSGEEYVMYEIPADQESVIIIPNKDYADFIYMDTEYSFGEIADDTRGELRFASLKEGAVISEASFRIFGAGSVFGEPDFILPSALTVIDESAFESISAKIVYIPDSCIKIGAFAFRNSAVEQIRIPTGCTIDDTAFYGCESVQIFGTSGSAAETFCNSHNNCTFIAE